MRFKLKAQKKQVRFDRILIDSKIWKPKWIEMVGTDPVPDSTEVFPSDHFGLFAQFEKKMKTNS